MKLFKIVRRMAAATTLAVALVGSSFAWTTPAPVAAQSPRADLCAQVSFKAGFGGDALVTAVAIALAESRCDPGATGHSHPEECTQSIDRGLYQIGTCGHPEVTNECAYEAQCNATAAYRISAQGTNWSAWRATYASGVYLSFVPEAQVAVGRLIPLRPACYAVSGDWDDNGTDTIGVACKDGNSYRWNLVNVNSGGTPHVDSQYGNSDACLPITGDWNGDGQDTVGVACKNGNTIRWSLVNAFRGSPSYPEFNFGSSNCWPATGDWNGDGRDTVAVACQSGNGIHWSMMNVHDGGTPQGTGDYGASSSCHPITGDWNGDGTTTVGAACRNSNSIRWSLVNASRGSPSYPEFNFGNSNTCQTVTGDWNGNGSTTIGTACAGHQLAWSMMNTHDGGTPQDAASYGSGQTYQPTAGWAGPTWPTWPHN